MSHYNSHSRPASCQALPTFLPLPLAPQPTAATASPFICPSHLSRSSASPIKWLLSAPVKSRLFLTFKQKQKKKTKNKTVKHGDDGEIPAASYRLEFEVIEKKKGRQPTSHAHTGNKLHPRPQPRKAINSTLIAQHWEVGSDLSCFWSFPDKS